LLAGVGGGVWSSIDEACKETIRIDARVEPQSEASATMNARYAMFRELYPALRGLSNAEI
jgi:xylulokinase